MAMAISDTGNVGMQRIYPRRAAVISWIFFDWAAQPYFR
jgi:UMF1 family MFS transporter